MVFFTLIYINIIKKLCWICDKSQSVFCGPGSSVGIATGYGLGGPGIECRLGRDFTAPVQTGPGAHPASYTMGTGYFPRGKERVVGDADPSPPPPPSSAVGH
jgi:hypothetical protein